MANNTNSQMKKLVVLNSTFRFEQEHEYERIVHRAHTHTPTQAILNTVTIIKMKIFYKNNNRRNNLYSKEFRDSGCS